MAGQLADLIRKKRADEEAANKLLRHTLTIETAKQVGDTFGDVDARNAFRRSEKLKTLIKEGKLLPDQLGPRDKSLVGSKFLKEYLEVPKPGEGDSSFLGIGGPVGESLGNFTQGAVDFGKGLPGGIYMTGKSLASDIGHNISNPSGLIESGGIPSFSESMPSTAKNIVNPTIQGYKEKYGHGSLGEIAHRALVEDPFGTVLDVGTLATLGAGATGKAGAIAAKTGTAVEGATAGEGVLGKIGTGLREGGNYFKQFGYKGTRGTRPDLVVGKNINFGREYGASPIVRATQRFTDKYLDKIPTVGETLANWRAKFAQHGVINTIAGRERILGSFMAAQHSEDFIKAAKVLDDDEATVLSLLKNGVNMQPVRPKGGVARGNVSALDAFKEYLDASLNNELPEGYNVQQMPGVDPESVKALRAKLDEPRVAELVDAPTPAMTKASDVWDEQVDRNLETQSIDPEEHKQRVWAPQQALRTKPEKLDEVDNAAEIEAIRDPQGAFERFSARRKAERGEEFPIAPNYVPHELAQGEYAGNLTKIKRPDPIEPIKMVTDSVNRRHPAFLSESDMQAFLSGAMRVGTEPLVRQIQNRERMLAHNDMIDQLVQQLGEKDRASGEVVRARNASEMQQMGFDPKTHVAVDMDGLVRFHKEEVSFLNDMVETVREAMREAPKDLAKREAKITESVKAYADDAAQKAMINITSASKPEGVVMTREAASHLQKTLDAMTPDAIKALRAYDRVMGYWRTALLAFSPRWWINTFIGSAFMSVISGAAKPRYARAAWHYGGKGERAAKLMKMAPELRPGLVGAEVHEAEILNAGKRFQPAQAAFRKVENIESFFKRMGFFHQLDKQGKAAMRQMDEVLDDYTRIGKMRDEYIDQLLQDKTFVAHSLDGVNKFYYNYTSLGPLERRWVRRVIPFYGWYKFITKLMYQLPFQYPGRTNVLNKMSEIAQEFEDNELGILPPQLQGAIFLNKDRSNLDYLPTFGLNPFSDFANPAAPEGTLQGLVSSQQLAPIFGAFMQAYGIDPYRGAPAELSPQDNLLQGRYGTVVDPQTGEEVPGGILGAFSTERLLGSIARSIPQVRTLETLSMHGRYPYPESIPFFDEKPVPVEAGTAYGDSGSATDYAIRSFLGSWPPKTENLRDYQEGLQEDVEYGEAKRKSQRKALRKAGVR